MVGDVHMKLGADFIEIDTRPYILNFLSLIHYFSEVVSTAGFTFSAASNMVDQYRNILSRLVLTLFTADDSEDIHAAFP